MKEVSSFLFVLRSSGGFDFKTTLRRLTAPAAFLFPFRGRALPVPLVGIHGLVAVVSFIFLLVTILGRA